MINLEVEKYCLSCPDFEPEVEKTKYSVYDLTDPFANDVTECETRITCKYASRCRGMYKRIIKNYNKGDNE